MIVDDLFENTAGPEKCWPGYRKVGTKPGTGRNAGKRVNDCEKIKESVGEFNIGDPVVITGDVQFRGKTGDVQDIGRDGAFVVVNLYNYGPHSFHASDVSLNDYADSDDEAEYQQGVAEGSVYKSRHAHKQEQDKAYNDYRTKHATSSLALMTRAEFAKDQRERAAKKKQGVAEGSNDDDLNDYYSGYYADLLSQIENMSATDRVNTKLGIKHSLENNEIRLVDLKTEIRSLERELKKLGVSEASDISGLITAASMVRDYIITAEVDGQTRRFRVRGMTGPRAAQERFLKHASQARVIDVKPVAEPSVAEADQEKIGDRYDAEEFDQMMLRLKTLAGAGPLKTVWDPERRVYKNVPINPQDQK